MFGRRQIDRDSAPPPPSRAREDRIGEAVKLSVPYMRRQLRGDECLEMSRADLARRVEEILHEVIASAELTLGEHERRDAVTRMVNTMLVEARKTARPKIVVDADKGSAAVAAGAATATGATVAPPPAPAAKPLSADASRTVDEAKGRLQPLLMSRIDVGKASTLPRDELHAQLGEVVSELLVEEKIHLNSSEQAAVVARLLDDMLGLGPLEPLLADDSVTDIMVNGPKQVYVERKGKLVVSDVVFRDDRHVLNVAQRIVSRIGRRVDESSPLVDARLEDGSRVNIIIPPLAIDGPSISIRKFSKMKITLDRMVETENLSREMAQVLKIASRARLNILISGGTGSGKTTLLNALSQMIDHGERVVTIEDAAELQLQQPHVVRLETRPANLEGQGEITQTDLVRNALRMRPDRIILGEIRGGEAMDMLQAMNTGHDGSLGTIHANRPREALTRLENMVAMSGVKLPNEAVRSQIAGALDMIVQIARMRDGVRRVTAVTEVVGMEGDIITTQDLFTYHYEGEDADGRLRGSFRPSGLRPHFLERAAYFGLDRALLEAVGT